MSTSSSRAPRGSLALLLVLLTANAALFAVWPWLRGNSVGAVTSDAPLNETQEAHQILRPPAMLRNPDYTSWLFDLVRQEQGVLYLGTSESIYRSNLGAQLNTRRPDDPPMVVLAQEGWSPIHNALAFARWHGERREIPPLLLVVNLVYFSHSHDVINDGWLSKVIRSPVFLYLNDGGIRGGLSPDVRRIYDGHFRRRKFLYPMYVQEYLGNLLYLWFHQTDGSALDSRQVPLQSYRRHAPLPEYDEKQGVHAGQRASDEMAKWRWQVSLADESVNLKGLQSIVTTLQGQDAPVLLLILPTNRTFYAFQGLDMEKFDRRYRDIRAAITSLAEPGHLFVLDQYDVNIHLGFVDRMHLDEYGYEQIIDLLDDDPVYAAFLDAVRGYYAGGRSGL